MATQQSNKSDELLQEMYEKYLHEYLPIIIFTSLTTLIGIFGNTLTILFYSKQSRKSSTINFIVALATVDIAVNLMTLTTIADMCINVYFTNRVLCKMMYLFDQWTVYSSTMILWVISVDRYRKVCTPFKKQFSKKSSSVIVLFFILTSLLFSIRNIWIYDIVKVDLVASDGVSHVNISYCTNTDDQNLSTIVTAFHFADIVCMSTILVTFMATYGKICLLLRQQKLFECRSNVGRSSNTNDILPTNMLAKSFTLSKNASVSQSVEATEETLQESPSKPDDGSQYNSSLNPIDIYKDNPNTPHYQTFAENDVGYNVVNQGNETETNTDCCFDKEVETIKEINADRMTDTQRTNKTRLSSNDFKGTKYENVNTNNAALKEKEESKHPDFSVLEDSKTKTSKPRSPKSNGSERNITFMMLTVSIGFTTCFTLFFIVCGFRMFNQTGEMELRGWMQFMLRGPMYNSVINPIIFCFFNPQFRRYVKNVVLVYTFKRCRRRSINKR